MNLTKWFRKNNKKVMAIVVVFLMVGFVGSAWLNQLRNARIGRKAVVATLANGKKITNLDFDNANNELEVLKRLKVDIILRGTGIKNGDLRTALLGELLFPEQGSSAQTAVAIKQMATKNGYSITTKQINDIYNRSMQPSVYWMLLTNEVQNAGVRVADADSAQLLGKVIPQLFQEATYSQVIGSLVRSMHVSEKNIVEIFAKMLSVMQYSSLICQNENITNQQAIYDLSINLEKLNTDIVEFAASVFAKDIKEPTEAELKAQFEKYKNNFAGQVTEENPYGFGYKLPDMVKLEYMAVQMSDIKKTLPMPTEEEKEDFYAKYRNQFVEEVPSDPNDPNSPQIQRIKTYAEVANAIESQLMQEKTNAKAEKILQQAKEITEAKIDGLDTEYSKITSEQFKQNASDYKTAAEKISVENKVKIYTGQTGLLNAAEMSKSKIIPYLYLDRQGSFSGIIQIAFAIDPINSSELAPLEQKARLYENIGPMKHAYNLSLVLFRVIETKKAAPPESFDQIISKKDINFKAATEDNYSVKENVAKDLKNLAAMDIAKETAEKFISQVKQKGWEDALAEYNKLYSKKNETDPNIINDVFKVQELKDLQRVSSAGLENLDKQSQGNPVAKLRNIQRKKNLKLIDKLYSMVPPDSNTIENLPIVTEFKPSLTVFVIKDISLQRFTRLDYEQNKPFQVDRNESLQSQNLAAVYFNPKNIVERNGFKFVPDKKQMKQMPVDQPNSPPQAQEAKP